MLGEVVLVTLIRRIEVALVVRPKPLNATELAAVDKSDCTAAMVTVEPEPSPSGCEATSMGAVEVEGALLHAPAGLLTLTTQEPLVADRVQLAVNAAGLVSETSQNVMVWLRRTASLRAVCSPFCKASVALRIRRFTIQAVTLGLTAIMSKAITAMATINSMSEKPWTLVVAMAGS